MTPRVDIVSLGTLSCNPFWGDAGACVLLQPEKPERGFELVDVSISAMRLRSMWFSLGETS